MRNIKFSDLTVMIAALRTDFTRLIDGGIADIRQHRNAQRRLIKRHTKFYRGTSKYSPRIDTPKALRPTTSPMYLKKKS